MNRQVSALPRILAFLLLVIALVVILYFGKAFLAPLALAAVLAMLMRPVERKLNQWGLPGWLSLTLVTLVLVSAIALFSLLLTLQIQGLADDWPEIKKNLMALYDQLRAFLKENLGVNLSDKKGQMLSKAGKLAQGQMMGFFSFLGNIMLVLVYFITMLMLRPRFKHFIQQLTPKEEDKRTHDILQDMAKVSKNYMFGKSMIVLMLAVAYTLVFVLVGIPYGLFLGFFAALLSFIPYIGNIIGMGLVALFALANGLGMLPVGIALGAMMLTQVLESYVLTPLIIGEEMEINPFFSIVLVVAGGFLWGIMGMLLALPLFGMAKAAFDHIPELKPWGYLMGIRKEVDEAPGTKAGESD